MPEPDFIGSVGWICPKCGRDEMEALAKGRTIFLRCKCGWESEPMEVSGVR